MLYKEAAQVLRSAHEKKSSVKNLVFASPCQNKKALYALVCQTLKYEPVLQTILEKSKVQRQHKALADDNLACVLLYDFLFGKGLGSAGNLKTVILKHKTALQAELARLKVKAKVSRNEDLLPENIKQQGELPRYVRVNTLKTSVQDVMEHFRREGYSMVYPPSTYDRYLTTVQNLEKKQFMPDQHIPELLVFASGTDFHDHVLYKSGDIILQDKASCLPAFILAPPRGSHVIDCCAAPGNKTTHAAAVMGNRGKIFAFDKDPKRLSTMNTLTLKAGALCVSAEVADFLTVDPHDDKYSKVEYAIVDPSCSGSGIHNRMNNSTDDEQSASTSRLQQLAKFQQAILKHVLSFPAMRKVAYSTCSVHAEENEAVIEKVLSDVRENFGLVTAMPGFPNRGNKDFSCGDKCIRLSPQKDFTNGFFVACFEKVSERDFPLSQKSQAGDTNKCRVESLAETSLDTSNSAAKQEASINLLSESAGKKKNHKKKRKATPPEEDRATLLIKLPDSKESGHKDLKLEDKGAKRGSNTGDQSGTAKKKKKKNIRRHKPVTC